MALFIHNVGADYNKADGAPDLLRAMGQTIKNGGIDKPYTAQQIRPETFFLLVIQRSVSSGQPGHAIAYARTLPSYSATFINELTIRDSLLGLPLGRIVLHQHPFRCKMVLLEDVDACFSDYVSARHDRVSSFPFTIPSCLGLRPAAALTASQVDEIVGDDAESHPARSIMITFA